MNKRRTKIIATLGPATDDIAVLQGVLEAGANLVRLNFSHSGPNEQKQRVQNVRRVSKQLGHEVGIVADLQGPKIRIGKFKNGHVTLEKGDTFTLDTAMQEEGDKTRVSVDYAGLTSDVTTGDILLLDDGKVQLTVVDIKSSQIITKVMTKSSLSNAKGVNRLGGGLSVDCLTEKDKQDIPAAIDIGADYIALSFPRNAADINRVREIINQINPEVRLISKIERKEAVDNIDEIIEASDAVMVARGDLGVEIGFASVPSVQKRIINRARALDKAVITATQMMESMIEETVPTRAEVSDVANAVLDGTDAVMLSAETAAGKYPVKAVVATSDVCQSAEKNPITHTSKHRLECTFTRVDEAIAMASMYTANHLHITAIIALSESGSTPLWMSRIRSGIPVYGLSRHQFTLRRMMLYRGVYPIDFDPTSVVGSNVDQAAVDTLLAKGLVQHGDLVIITKGDYMGQIGGTNAMRILEVSAE